MQVLYLKIFKLSDHRLNMSDFSESIFEKKLVELRDSQKEIQALSQFCVHHRQHAKIVVKVNTNFKFMICSELILIIIGLV